MSVRFVDIYPDEDQVRLAELASAVDKARKQKGTAPRLMAEVDPAVEAEQAHDEFAAEVESRRIRVFLKHLPRKEWRTLMREHSPRPDVEEDKPLGVNMDTLPDVLVLRSIDTEQSENLPDDLDAWLETLSDVDYYDRLFLQAFGANRGTAILADPTQRLASASRQTFDETSS